MSIKKLLRRSPQHAYTGKYGSLHEARSESNNSQDYGNKRYDKRSINKLSLHEKYTHGRNMIILSTAGHQKNWNIINIGGGVNPIFSHLSHIQKLNTKCFTLEREEICEKLNSKIPEKYSDNLFYTSSIDQIDHTHIDIAYFGSSIQYIEEHQSLLLGIIKKSPKFIIFSESIFTDEDKDYYVLQTNMGTNVFPNRFTSLENLDSFLHKHQYRASLNMAVPGPHDHERINRSTYECRTLIYKREINISS